MTGRPTRICYPFSGDDIGGSHISLLGLLAQLDRRRFEPIVLIEQAGGRIEQMMRSADVDIRHVAGLPKLAHGEQIRWSTAARIARTTVPLASLLRSIGADIVHTNDGRTHATWAVPAKLAGAKLLWHHRGSPDARGLRFLAPHLADAIISVSAFALGGSGLNPSRTRVIHSPFDTRVNVSRAARRADLIAELGCAPDTRLLGFFGVMIDRKRPLRFVEAIAAMRREMPLLPVQGVMFGTPLEIDEATVMAHAERLGVAGAIHLMGFRTPGADWIAACDLLLVPAVEEPFGRTLIEAMLVGTPVIATRSGGNIEALQDGRLGVLVRPEDPAAMADEALRLLADGARYDRYADAARYHARHHFDAERHARSIMALYDDLIPTPRDRRRLLAATL